MYVGENLASSLREAGKCTKKVKIVIRIFAFHSLVGMIFMYVGSGVGSGIRAGGKCTKESNDFHQNICLPQLSWNDFYVCRYIRRIGVGGDW